MNGPLFSPAPSGGNGRRASATSRTTKRTEDPRTTVLHAVSRIISKAPAELGEKLNDFKKLCQETFSSAKLAPKFSAACAAVLDGGEGSRPERAQAFIELCLAVSSSALGKTALKFGLQFIPGIYGQGLAHAKRLNSMAEAVADSKGEAEATTRSRALNLPRLFAAFDPSSGVYTGTSYALENLCKKLAVTDPFQAVARAKRNWPLRSELAGGLSGEKVKADSTGGMMTSSNVYRMVNTKDSEAPPFVCGIDALTSIMGAFSSDRRVRAAWRNTPALKEQRAREIGAEIKSKALADLLGDPVVEEAEALLDAVTGADKSSPVDDAERSHSVRRKQAILDALNAEIKAALNDRETLSAGRRGLLPALRRPSYQLENQPTGVWLNWFANEIQNDPLNFPEHIEVAFRELSDPHSDLSSKERAYYTRALVLYQAKRSPISRDLALADIRSDAKWYERFADTNPGDTLVQKFGSPAELLLPAQALLRSPERSMSLAELRAAEVPLTGLMRLRSHQNRSTYERFEAEIQEVLATLEPLFLEPAGASEKAWREDSRGEAVPMERLRETLAGLALGRDDFFYVREMVRFNEFALQIDPKLKDGTLGEFSEMPIADFEAMVQGCIIAGRKVAHLGNLLKSRGREVGPEVLGQACEEGLLDLKEKTLRGGKYQLIEDATGLDRQSAVGAFMRAQAFNIAVSSDKDLRKHFLVLKHQGPVVGLCHTDDAKTAAAIIRAAKKPQIQDAKLYSRTDLSEIERVISTHTANPLILPSHYAFQDKAWYSQSQFDTRKNLSIALTQAASNAGSGELADAKLAELLTKYDRETVFLQGGFRVNPRLQFQVKSRLLLEVARSSEDRKEVIRWENETPIIETATSGDVSVRYYRREGLERLLQSLERSLEGTVNGNTPWVQWSSLPEWWKNAARQIVTASALSGWQRKITTEPSGKQFPTNLGSLAPSDSDTWAILVRDTDFSPGARRQTWLRAVAKSPEKLFVSREIVDVVSSLAARFGMPSGS